MLEVETVPQQWCEVLLGHLLSAGVHHVTQPSGEPVSQGHKNELRCATLTYETFSANAEAFC